MRTRGRRSAAELAVIPIRPRDHRLRPPDDLGADEAALFRELVASCRADHFVAADAHLLACYAQALLISRRSAGDPTLLQRWEKATRLAAQLAPKLRLCPSSRQDAKTAARHSADYRPSYYDLQRDDDAYQGFGQRRIR